MATDVTMESTGRSIKIFMFMIVVSLFEFDIRSVV